MLPPPWASLLREHLPPAPYVSSPAPFLSTRSTQEAPSLTCTTCCSPPAPPRSAASFPLSVRWSTRPSPMVSPPVHLGSKLQRRFDVHFAQQQLLVEGAPPSSSTSAAGQGSARLPPTDAVLALCFLSPSGGAQGQASWRRPHAPLDPNCSEVPVPAPAADLLGVHDSSSSSPWCLLLHCRCLAAWQVLEEMPNRAVTWCPPHCPVLAASRLHNKCLMTCSHGERSLLISAPSVLGACTNSLFVCAFLATTLNSEATCNL